jgi:hypothetical protein
VDRERGVRYGSINGRPVLAAGIVSTAVITNTAHHRARGDSKQVAATIQHETRVANRVARYQRKTVQSMERWVSLAVPARMGLKRDKR